MLDAAERRDRGADESGVDADHAALERARHAPHAADIARVEIRGQAEFGVVGKPDGLGLVLEAEQRRHRSENLFLRQAHAGVHIGEHRGLVEGAAQRVPAAADQRLGAAAHRLADELFHLGQRRLIDQRTLLDTRIQRRCRPSAARLPWPACAANAS